MSQSVRSSIHSLRDSDEISNQDLEAGEKEEEKQSKSSGSIKRTGLIRIDPGLAFPLAYLILLLYSVFFSRTNDILASENLPLCLIFVAVALFQIVYEIKQSKSKPVHRDSEGTTLFVQFYSNRDFYEGECNRRRSHGSGVHYYYYPNGRYKGDWIDGRYDGYGIESCSNGSKYKGQYKQGIRHGYGVYRFSTGGSYSGEWVDGQCHGFGVQTYADGSSYVGELKFGVKHGLGSSHFRDGDKYAGEYFEDKIHGFGVYHFANGNYYEGAWHEDRKEGYGTYGFKTGDTKCGEWDDCNLVNRLSPETGLVRKAVQSAREMARKCVDQRRVDEQVVRAVAAAENAAKAARVAAVKAVQNQMNG